MRGTLRAASAVAMLATLAVACAGGSPTDASAPGTVIVTVTMPVTTPAPAQQATPSTAVSQPTIKVIGSCNDRGGLRLEAHGFTPNGSYLTVASYPDNTPYTNLANGGRGRADANGQLPSWSWNCKDGANGQPDPTGTYNLKVVDLTTGAAAETTFEVKY